MENVETWKIRVLDGKLVIEQTSVAGNDLPDPQDEKLTPEQVEELVRAWKNLGGTASQLFTLLRKLPEGIELNLRLDEDDIADDLTEAEMLQLRRSLDEGGEVPAQEVIDRLRQR